MSSGGKPRLTCRTTSSRKAQYAVSRILRIPGLDPDKEYAVIVDQTGDIAPEDDKTMVLPVGPRTKMRGDALMYAGLPMPNFRGDFRSALIYLSEI